MNIEDDFDKMILEYIEGYPNTEETLQSLKELSIEDFDRDPSFRASFTSGMFINDVLIAMEARKLLKIDMAKRMGVSRQSFGKTMNHGENLTVKHMTEIAMAMGLDIEIKLKRKYIKRRKKK